MSHICPYPPTNGGAIKTWNILKHLGTKHDVAFLTFVRREREIEALKELAPFCRETGYVIIERSGSRNLFDAFKSLLAHESFIISRDYRPEMQSRVLDMLRSERDLVYVDHLQMFQYVPHSLPCPVVLDNHNVEWRIIERFSQTSNPGKRALARIEWPKLRDFELGACRRADLVLTVTDEDRSVLVANGISSPKISAVPIGVDVEHFRPLPIDPRSRRVLTFGTMSWPPNIDAVSHFVRDIYPMVKEAVPGVSFSVVGANPPASLVSLEERDASIEVTGFVDDIRSASEGAAVFVVPLRVGSGMRVKILDAMAMGLPVVTTSVGCEGIDLETGTHALVADSPEKFARAVVQLIEDPDARRSLGLAGRRLVESRYSWQPILHSLDDALESIPFLEP